MTAIVSRNGERIFTTLQGGPIHPALGPYVTDAFYSAFDDISQRPWVLVRDIELVGSQALKQIESWAPQFPEVERLYSTPCEVIDAQCPQAVAIDSWDGAFTYSELSSLTDALALELHERAFATRGHLIPVCFEKSAWAIVAMLAIHKVGAAFVPIDPACPSERLHDILAQTRAHLILASRRQAKGSCLTSVMDSKSLMTMVVDVDLFTCLRLADTHDVQRLLPTPDRAAYCQFTSGSTGRPKGVVVEHSALAASLSAHGYALGLGPKSRVLQNTPYTFDVSITEIFGTLYHGGCVCIPDDAARIHDTVACINRMNINWAFFTPSFAQILDGSAVSSLEILALGGEAPTATCIQQWEAPGRRLINAYGPTECTIFSMIGDIDLQRRTAANIGRPVGGTCFVTDPENPARLMPIGAPGELLLCGPILARGYLHDPEKTEKAFIQPPPWLHFFGRSGYHGRLYRTGDLVRYCDDGTLEYLGRKDRQVKINGQRLELGEVEEAIHSSYSTGRAAVEVVHHPSKANHQVLVALLAFPDTSNTGDLQFLSPELYRAEIDEISSRITTLLPRYMIPSYFIPVSRLPLSSSGKLDRVTLRSLGLDFLRSVCQRIVKEERQRSRTELIMLSAWADVLSVSPGSVGLDDNFFLFGDSLAAIKLVRRLRDDGIEMSLMDVFQNPTISQMLFRTKVARNSSLVPPSRPFALVSAADRASLIAVAAHQCGISEDLIQDIYACTPMQLSLMATAACQPRAYQACYVYRLPQQLDIHRFREAWEIAISKAPILRSRIFSSSQSLMQAVIDHQPRWDTESDLALYLERAASVQFTLGTELTRFALVTGSHRSVSTYFVWIIHHVLYDGHSLQLMLEDVRRVYANKDRLPRSPFRDYVSLLTTRNYLPGDSFWREHLEGFTPTAFAHPRREGQQAIADQTIMHHSSFQRPAQVAFLPSVLMQAAWGILLSRYLESRDVVFGVTLSGRYGPLETIDQILGPTLSTVPLRVQIDGQQGASSFLTHIQSHLARVMEHDTHGLQRIRSLSSSAASACEFQTLLVIQPPRFSFTDGPFEEKSLIRSEEVIAGYPLTIEVQLVEDGPIEVRAHFDSAILTQEKVQRMLQQWDHILEQLVNISSEQPISSISITSTQDLVQMAHWNQGVLQLTQGQGNTIHEIIGHRVREHPEREAICGWDATLTYTDVWSLASCLAQHLRAAGVSHGDLVPLCLDKSSYTVVCMIAVMMAGAAFVPLDVRHPPERLKGIVTQTRARLVITSPEHQHLWAPQPHLVVDRQRIQDLHLAGREETPLNPVSPQDVAYVIFTSGSSGQPKGVLIQHQAICASIRSYSQPLNIRATDRVLQFASYAFDACVLEIFSTLVCGGTVCGPSIEECMDSIAQTIEKYKPTWALLTPSVVQTLRPSEAGTLCTLVLGGEPITTGAIAAWKDRVTLINAYGPTECSVVCAARTVSQPSDVGVIGYPLGSAHWVVDPQNHDDLLPIGSVGELLVEGPIVAKGYLNNPDKTATTFISFPSWRQRIDLPLLSSRMYKTGDLVRWNGDGTLSCMGRRDLQVKVNGQRLELEEIESKIDHPVVESRAIIQARGGPFVKKLVAFVSLRSAGSQVDKEGRSLPLDLREEAATTVSSLQAKLSEELPKYMVPSIWIPLTKMPLSSSGKTDRRLLGDELGHISPATCGLIAKLVQGTDHSTTAKSSILTAAETSLRHIWSTVLNIPEHRIGAGTSFFHVGGDSVSAMQLVAQARTQGFALSTRDVLHYKTLSKIAQRMKSMSKQIERPTIDWSRRPFPPSPVQQMFLDELSSENIPMFTQSLLLQVKGHIEPSRLLAAVHTVVSRHPMLRARFHRDRDSSWSQQILGDTVNSYAMAVHEGNVEWASVAQMSRATREKLDVFHGPTLAGDLFSSQGDRWLFLAAHHLVIDLVSWRVILKELELVLRSSPLPPVSSIPFPEWCTRLAEWCASKTTQEQFSLTELTAPDYDYWGMTNVPNTYGMVSRLTTSVDREATSRILSICADGQMVEFLDILIGTLLVAFTRVFTDRNLPSTFLEHHGREPWTPEIDITTTIGWFTTLSPLTMPELDKSAHIDIADTIRRARDCRRQLPANGLGFFSSVFLTAQAKEQFRDLMRPEVMFNYEGTFQQLEGDKALFEMVPQPDGDLGDMAVDTPRLALIEIGVQLHQGQIHVSCMYNSHMRHGSRIEQFLIKYGEVLTQAPEAYATRAPVASLTDFPLASLSYAELDELLESVAGHRVQTILPALPVQKLMISHQLAWPPLYRPRIAFELRTGGRPVNSRDIATAWRETVAHQPILRTVLDNVADSGPKFQMVLADVMPAIEYAERVEDMLPISLKTPAWPGDKAQPNHRLSICTRQEDSPIVLLEINHALIDVRTMEILLAEFANRLVGNSLDRSGPELAYDELISRAFAPSSMASSHAFWQRKLSDCKVCRISELLPDNGYGQLGVHPIPFGNILDDARDILQRQEVSLFTIFRLAWARVLQLHLNTDDVTFGVVLNGRDIDIPNVHEIAGPFLNFVPCRVTSSGETSGNESITDLLERLDHGYLESLAHQAHAYPTTELFDTIINFRKRTGRQLLPDTYGSQEASFKIIDSLDPYHVSHS
jgi:amino acid adenylation domain-containing protein/non-ribosomal peptide synthase protein (TIGR01720 family)